ncbi:MAG: CocE/NonD family hydrolase [Flavobacteriales bacterium]|nr:CocE/NonD family hydrolase [Flavobacteriales bacterium]
MRISFVLLFCLSAMLVASQPEWETIAIPMSDGESLAADLYLPDGDGPFPVVFIQTPYNKDLFHFGLPLGVGWEQASQPYAFVIMDWRCYFASASACVADSDTGVDGYDAVEWIAAQDWCDGKVGTYGPSALATVQYKTAVNHPPHLVCCVPEVGSPKEEYDRFYPGGAARQELIESLGTLFGVYDIYASFPYYNLVWSIAESATTYAPDIEVPMLLIGGWFDINCRYTVRTFNELKAQSPAAADCKMLMGPWVHGGNGPAYVGSENQGDLSFPEAAGGNAERAWAFFDYHMRGIQNGWDQQPNVEYFQTGNGQWQSSNEWPPTQDDPMAYYLTSDHLLSSALEPESSAMTYTYDPIDPSPTIGGQALGLPQGPFDLSEQVESRDDIEIFSLPAIDSDIHIAGSVVVNLFVSTDRTDTDFTVRLTDVDENGHSYMISSQIQRMRFLNGYTEGDEELITPGQTYEISLELPPVAYTFPVGHSLRLIVSSSNYPYYSRNANNGEAMYPDNNLDSLLNPVVALNSVHVGGDTPSHALLPLVDILDDIVEVPSAHEVMVYPNPAAEYIAVKGIQGSFELTISDLNGREVMTCALHGEQRCAVSHLPNGAYLCTITNQSTSRTVYFIKQ